MKELLLLAFVAFASATTCDKAVLEGQLSKIHIDEKTGGEFYKLFFETIPEAKKYFPVKFEHVDEVPSMPYFQKQGKAFLMMLKNIVEHCDSEKELGHYLEQLKEKHEAKHITVETVKKAKPVIRKFITEKAGKMTEEQEHAWDNLNKLFQELYKRKVEGSH